MLGLFWVFFFFAFIPDNKMENKVERKKIENKVKTSRNSLNFPNSDDFLSSHVLDFGV